MFPDWLVFPAFFGAAGQPVVVSLSADEQLEE
jgi:hypothetical protein